MKIYVCLVIDTIILEFCQPVHCNSILNDFPNTGIYGVLKRSSFAFSIF